MPGSYNMHYSVELVFVVRKNNILRLSDKALCDKLYLVLCDKLYLVHHEIQGYESVIYYFSKEQILSRQNNTAIYHSEMNMA